MPPNGPTPLVIGMMQAGIKEGWIFQIKGLTPVRSAVVEWQCRQIEQVAVERRMSTRTTPIEARLFQLPYQSSDGGYGTGALSGISSNTSTALLKSDASAGLNVRHSYTSLLAGEYPLSAVTGVTH